MIEIYGLDNGYAQTKLWGKDKAFHFKTRIQETTEDYISGRTILEYQGKRYIIGQGTEDINLNKTNRMVHKICTYAALSRAIEKYTDIRLVLGLPMSHYMNREAREAFKDYINRPEIICMKYNGLNRSFGIVDTVIFPQGAAALYAYNPGQYKGRLISVLDIGGITVNGCVFEDLYPLPDSMVTINAGVIILQNKIKSALNEKLFFNIQDYEVPYLMKKQDYQKIIEPVIDEHFESIKNELRKKNWSLETLPIIGVGGGILTFQGAIKKHFPLIEFSEDPVYANARGLYRIGVALWA